ncbi:hypothetical protein [Actinomadura rayongensis]|uniref:Uncharacterized protein n=1 Tax=Actinomadura rayongensis TaxID=1429076 RepID=A0A6I4WDD6_9ACTN|nr:hypothetical protein [Actinomadura rayongensis]MXQ67738.1 hypothetical protein [Actinomadura rayongensis]
MTACEVCPAGHLTMTGLPVCESCYGEVAAALDALPGLLTGLGAATARSLARPARELPGPPRSPGPSAPADETVIDLRAELKDAVRAWAALAGIGAAAPPVRALATNLASALAAPGGTAAAARLLHLTAAARRRLDPPEVIRLRERCPECGTLGLLALSTHRVAAWCSFCEVEVTRAV